MASTPDEGILIAQHGSGASMVQCFLRPDKANRHGLITGATGTGKTITLQTLAEGFSNAGVPVFMADIKGDLTGISQKGVVGDKLAKIIAERGLTAPESAAYPTTLWDVFGEQGHPVRATVSDLGPLLLARMLNLNETQTGVLQLVFKIADDDGLLLLDLKDLRAMCQHVGDNASDFTTEYGNVSAASIGAIQRGLLQIEGQGGEKFFGEPMLNIADFMQTDGDGKGLINILAADKLMNSPRLYATFLLWMLSELFESLPEVGDLDKPKMVFFFDEAHLLFNDAPKVLLERIELVVRLVRSKGVGVYFVTQNPLDIPDTVLAQLGNRVQHALRAFTPRDQKAVKICGRHHALQPRPGHWHRHYRTGRGRSPGEPDGRKGPPVGHAARVCAAAQQPDWPHHPGPAQDADRHLHRGRCLRKAGGPRLGLRIDQRPHGQPPDRGHQALHTCRHCTSAPQNPAAALPRATPHRPKRPPRPSAAFWTALAT